MKEEITKVLSMVQDGKIDADKAADIISARKAKQDIKTPDASAYMDKKLRVRVISKENDNVSVDLPKQSAQLKRHAILQHRLI